MSLVKRLTGVSPARPELPWVVLVMTAVLTAGLSFFADKTTGARHRLQFLRVASRIDAQIQTQLKTYMAFLRAAGALFSVDEQVTSNEFLRYVDILGLEQRFPGVQSIGYLQRIPSAELAATRAEMVRQGSPWKIWPEGDRSEYLAVLYLASVDYRNRELLGYDMWLQPALRAAMELARDSGEPVISALTPLLPSDRASTLKGVFVFAPVYAGRTPPMALASRRANLRGFVFSAVRLDVFVARTLGAPIDVDLRIFERPERTPDTLIFDSKPDGGDEVTGSFVVQREIEAGGRYLFVVYVDPPDILETWLAQVVFVGGIALSVLLYRATRTHVDARLSAEQAAAELRASQEALRESEAEAVAANHAKDAFLATLSHEMRTPLNAILGWASMLRSGKVESSRQGRALEIIERNARVQTRLIEDLFDVSRIVSGKLRIERQPTEVAPAIAAAVESVRQTADEKGVSIRVYLTPEADSARLHADAARLQQILWNLLSNAIKFTPAQGHVSVVVQRADDRVEIAVSDTGIGIDPEFLPHVFERFRQGDSTTTRQYGGMGLGLAIVHFLAEAHGGTVSADSPGQGRGATFTVTLPVATGEAGEASDESVGVSDEADAAEAEAPARRRAHGGAA